MGNKVKGKQARKNIAKINDAINNINPKIRVLHRAGIYSGEDVYEMALLGAEATGATSGIIKGGDPVKAFDEMIAAMRKGYD